MDDEALLRHVRQLAETLRAVALALGGEPRWSDRLRRCADRLDRKDLGGAEQALKAFGGMGSVNDLVVDGETQRMLTTVYDLARDVQREAVRRGLS